MSEKLRYLPDAVAFHQAQPQSGPEFAAPMHSPAQKPLFFLDKATNIARIHPEKNDPIVNPLYEDDYLQFDNGDSYFVNTSAIDYFSKHVAVSQESTKPQQSEVVEVQKQKYNRSQAMEESWKDENWREHTLAYRSSSHYRNSISNGLKGHEVTESTRRQISNAQKGIPETEEAKRNMSEAKGGIKLKIDPLAKLGFGISEIIDVTGFSREQVKNGFQRMRKSGDLPPTNPEQDKAAKGYSQRLRHRRNKDLNFNSVYLNDSFFLKKLLGGDLLPNSSSLKELIDLYDLHQQTIPDFLVQQVKLAFFYSALREAQKGDQNNMLFYNSLISTRNPDYFVNGLPADEQFIFEAVMSGKTRKTETSQENTPIVTKEDGVSNVVSSPHDKDNTLGLTRIEGMSDKGGLWNDGGEIVIDELPASLDQYIAVKPKDRVISDSNGLGVARNKPRSIKERLRESMPAVVEDRFEAVLTPSQAVNRRIVEEKLVPQHQEFIRYASFLSRDNDNAEEVVQESYERIIKSATITLDPKGNFSAYFIETLKAVVLDRARKKGRRPQVSDGSEEKLLFVMDPSESVDNKAMSRIEFDQILTLIRTYADNRNDPETHYQLYLQHFLFGKTERELAREFGFPVGTIKTRFRFFKKFMREELGQRGIVPDGYEERNASVDDEKVSDVLEQSEISEEVSQHVIDTWSSFAYSVAYQIAGDGYSSSYIAKNAARVRSIVEKLIQEDPAFSKLSLEEKERYVMRIAQKESLLNVPTEHGLSHCDAAPMYVDLFQEEESKMVAIKTTNVVK